MAVITGTNVGETLPGTPSDDIVDGLQGNDIALMAGGNDVFLWNPGDGSDVVEGGSGIDTVHFNGANINEAFEIFGAAGRAQLTRNVANIVMDMNDVERLELQALGGADTIVLGDLTGTDLKQVAVDLSAAGLPGVGDGAFDGVTANASATSNTIDITAEAGVITISGLPAQMTIAGAETTDGLTVNGLNGNDRIDASTLPSAAVALVLDGGAGNDTILGGQGADLLLGGDGNDTVTGGRGADVALLGSGNDRFVWNPGDGSDVVEGQADFDTLVFNGTAINENFDISANGGRIRLFRDVANVVMDLDDIERVEIHAGNGSDTVVVNDLTGTDVTEVLADLASSPGGSSADGVLDTVIVNATGGVDVIAVAAVGGKIVTTGLAATVIVDHADKTDTLSILAGIGDDTIDAGKLAAGKIDLLLQGGAGADTLIGGAGNDRIFGNTGNDIAQMGGGNDTFTWNPGDGSDTVGGGAGNDTLQFNGANIAEHIDISANGGNARFTRDIANIVIALDDVERIAFRALGGADVIALHDLSGTDVKQVAIDLGSGAPGVGDGAVNSLTADASNAANSILLTQSDPMVENVLRVTGLPLELAITDAEATDTLRINGLGGNDKIDASAVPATAVALSLSGGAGNDTIIGSQGANVLLGDDGDDTVTGGRGDDVALLGAGNDRFVWNPGDGSDVVEGQADFDTLVFNGTAINENFDISANGGRIRLFRDVANVVMDLDDIERVEIHAGNGSDTVVVNDLTGTDVTEVLADLASSPGGSSADGVLDTVIVNATGGVDVIAVAAVGGKIVTTGLAATVIVDHADKTDTLSILAGIGDDTIDAGKLAAGKIGLLLQGGAGADTLIGGAGNDRIFGNTGNDIAQMGGGNDTFTWNPGDGSDTVGGGAGNDTLQFNGANIAEHIDISANGGNARFTRDIANIVIGLDDVERIAFRALGGADVITVNDLAGTDVKQVDIDLAAAGGAGDGAANSVIVNGSLGNDTVTVALAGGVILVGGLAAQVTISGAEPALDRLTVNGLGGDDAIDASQLPAVVTLLVDGGSGNDTITGSLGDDVIIGNDGNDTVAGEDGADTVLLGAGDDLFLWTRGDGIDVVEGQADGDTVRATGGKDGDFFAVSANGARALILEGLGGLLDVNDVERIELKTLAGADVVSIGDMTGTDVAEIAVDLAATAGGKAADAEADTVTVNGPFGGSFSVTAIGAQMVVTNAVSGLTVTVDHWGKTDALALSGSAGADVFDAGLLAAGKMALQMFGGSGVDVFFGGAGNDTVVGGAGNDVALLGAGNDRFVWNPGDDSDVVEGQGGTDTLAVNGDAGVQLFSLLANGARAEMSYDFGATFTDMDGIERVEVKAGGGSDLVSVEDLSGTAIKQIAIDLGMPAGIGDGSADNVYLAGSGGDDTISVTLGAAGIGIGGLPAQVTIVAAEAGDFLALLGGAGNDRINAGALKAGSPQLEIDGGDGNDQLTGGLGNDSLFGENQADILRGGGGNDFLSGGSDKDTLDGGAGDDILVGGVGDDAITGGLGADTIRYTNILDGHDVITAFDGNPVGGQDTLDLDTLFDSLGVLAGARAGRVSILDNGATVDVAVDADGNLGNGFELTVATLKTADTIALGQDVLVGT